MRQFRHEILTEITLAGLYRAVPETPLDVSSAVEKLPTLERTTALELLRELFFCYRLPTPSDLFCLELLFDAILKGHLDVSSEFISTPPRIDNLESSTEYEVRGRRGESPEHSAMKRWVREHLKSKSIDVSADEVSRLGYRVDVGGLRVGVFVECGDTEPRKVFEFLRHSLSIGILQYRSEEILWLTPRPSFPDFANLAAQGHLA